MMSATFLFLLQSSYQLNTVLAFDSYTFSRSSPLSVSIIIPAVWIYAVCVTKLKDVLPLLRLTQDGASSLTFPFALITHFGQKKNV